MVSNIEKLPDSQDADRRRHACTHCEKRFVRPSGLRTHMRSHTGEKRNERRYVYANN
ncbi:hypothetical protein PHLGIDRAFT_24763 [Phlebiopsis gigantea 11061_1 CR5-6]|uniref:C2H2-type domain-containing protein n=1 Tax=Phlebiopsis gigantea (strain 11061_1 CR5-6) TaxID=745531 RepID=A0A0C3NM05_PHLG1|nr:hypothetical protein PHLGIDRAFT_24763 [Phlebiopsis gigantea 11061_1 CR5-6]